MLTDVRLTTLEELNTQEKLRNLLKMDLNFHNEDSSQMSHDFHAFPAKFPPQLPRLFITHLTNPGERVLDPMMGSGTCVLEAVAVGREGVGLDIDPLAVMLSKVKLNYVNPEVAQAVGLQIAERAESALHNGALQNLEKELSIRFNPKTRKFVDYWFSFQTQLELTTIIREIEKVEDYDVKEFLTLVFSAIIITKSGGVSLAWDLAHTRPHKLNQGAPKSYRPAVKEFRKRLLKNINGLIEMNADKARTFLQFGNAEVMPLKSNSVDLLFTSPPYASNAIDYMRAHKFSLVWLGHHVDQLSELRSKYIGGEKVSSYDFLDMPPGTKSIIASLAAIDKKKSLALHRYYSEMRKVVSEAFRVLKPGKAAVFVVGSSMMRGIDSQTQMCLGEIGSMVGFDLVGIGTRKLDRDRRMLPARIKKQQSQIEERMHEEYVVALVKPDKELKANGKN